MDVTSRVLAGVRDEAKLWGARAPLYVLSDWYRDRGQHRAADVLLICWCWNVAPARFGPNGHDPARFYWAYSRPIDANGNRWGLGPTYRFAPLIARYGYGWIVASAPFTLYRRLWHETTFSLDDWAYDLEKQYGPPRDGWTRVGSVLDGPESVAGAGGG